MGNYQVGRKPRIGTCVTLVSRCPLRPAAGRIGHASFSGLPEESTNSILLGQMRKLRQVVNALSERVAGLEQKTREPASLVPGFAAGQRFGGDDGQVRGLHFLAYQTSIDDQFEFVTGAWVNNPDFLQSGAGHDPIIGQSSDPDRVRKFKLVVPVVDGGAVQRVVKDVDTGNLPAGQRNGGRSREL